MISKSGTTDQDQEPFFLATQKKVFSKKIKKKRFFLNVFDFFQV